MFPRTVRATLSRRAFGATIATATLALVAACGNDDDASSSTPAGSTSAAADVFPVTITHKFGQTVIKAKPAKVVVVGLTEQDALLALGTVPIATTKWFGDNAGEIWPWAKASLGSGTVPQVLTNTDGIQFEKIAALQPDLIVGMYSNVAQADYDKLSAIAPTLAQPKGANDFGVSWDVVTTAIGQALGVPDKAKQLVDDVNARFAAAKKAHPTFGGRTALMASTYQGYFVYSPTDPRNTFLASLGFTAPDGLAEAVGTQYGANISKERIDLLDVDALVWFDPAPKSARATFAKDALYDKLDVYKQGRDVFLSDGTDTSQSTAALGSATAFVTVLSLPYLIENLVPLLAEAADGDPATKVEDGTA